MYIKDRGFAEDRQQEQIHKRDRGFEENKNIENQRKGRTKLYRSTE